MNAARVAQLYLRANQDFGSAYYNFTAPWKAQLEGALQKALRLPRLPNAATSPGDWPAVQMGGTILRIKEVTLSPIVPKIDGRSGYILGGAVQLLVVGDSGPRKNFQQTLEVVFKNQDTPDSLASKLAKEVLDILKKVPADPSSSWADPMNAHLFRNVIDL